MLGLVWGPLAMIISAAVKLPKTCSAARSTLPLAQRVLANAKHHGGQRSEDAALVCFDLETNGSADKEVVQIGTVCKGAVFDRLVRPRLSMSQFPHTSRVHGLCDEDVRDSPSFGQVFVESFKPWLDEHIQPQSPRCSLVCAICSRGSRLQGLEQG